MAFNDQIILDIVANVNSENLSTLISQLGEAKNEVSELRQNMSGMDAPAKALNGQVDTLTTSIDYIVDNAKKLQESLSLGSASEKERDTSIQEIKRGIEDVLTLKNLISDGGSFSVNFARQMLQGLPEEVQKEFNQITPKIMAVIRRGMNPLNSGKEQKISARNLEGMVSDAMWLDGMDKILGQATHATATQKKALVQALIPTAGLIHRTSEYQTARYGGILPKEKDIEHVEDMLPAMYKGSYSGRGFIRKINGNTSAGRQVLSAAGMDQLASFLESNSVAARAIEQAGLASRDAGGTLVLGGNITRSKLHNLYGSALWKEFYARTRGLKDKLSDYYGVNQDVEGAEAINQAIEKKIISRGFSGTGGTTSVAMSHLDALLGDERLWQKKSAEDTATARRLENEQKRLKEQYVVEKINPFNNTRKNITLAESQTTRMLGLQGHNYENTDLIKILDLGKYDYKNPEQKAIVDNILKNGYTDNGKQYSVHSIHGTGSNTVLRMIEKKARQKVSDRYAPLAAALGLNGSDVWNAFVDPNREFSSPSDLGKHMEQLNKMWTDSYVLGSGLEGHKFAFVDFSRMGDKFSDGLGYALSDILPHSIQARFAVSGKGSLVPIHAKSMKEWGESAGLLDKSGRLMMPGKSGKNIDVSEMSGLIDKSLIKNIPAFEGLSDEQANEALTSLMQIFPIAAANDYSFDGSSKGLGYQMMSFMSLSPAIMKHQADALAHRFRELETNEGKRKYVFNNPVSDYIAQRVNDPINGDKFLNTDLQALREVELYRQKVLSRVSSGEWLNFDNESGSIDDARLVRNPLTAYLMSSGALSKEGLTEFKQLSYAKQHGKISNEDFKSNINASALNTVTNILESAHGRSFTPEEVIKYLSLEGGALDFENEDQAMIGAIRSPTGFGQFVARANYAKILRPVFEKLGLDTSGLFLNDSDLQTLAGADFDGDQVKRIISQKYRTQKGISIDDYINTLGLIESGDYVSRYNGPSLLDEIKKTISNYEKLNISPEERAVKTTDLETLPGGNLITNLANWHRTIELSKDATQKMGFYSSVGARLSMLDLADPMMRQFAVMADMGNEGYDPATTLPKKPKEITHDKALYQAIKLGRTYQEIANHLPEMFNVEAETDENGNVVRYWKPDSNEEISASDVFTTKSGKLVDLRKLRGESPEKGFDLDKVNLPSRYSDSVMGGLYQLKRLYDENVLDDSMSNLLTEIFTNENVLGYGNAGPATKKLMENRRKVLAEFIGQQRFGITDEEAHVLSTQYAASLKEIDEDIAKREKASGKIGNVKLDDGTIQETWQYRDQQISKYGLNQAALMLGLYRAKINGQEVALDTGLLQSKLAEKYGQEWATEMFSGINTSLQNPEAENVSGKYLKYVLPEETKKIISTQEEQVVQHEIKQEVSKRNRIDQINKEIADERARRAKEIDDAEIAKYGDVAPFFDSSEYETDKTRELRKEKENLEKELGIAQEPGLGQSMPFDYSAFSAAISQGDMNTARTFLKGQHNVAVIDALRENINRRRSSYAKEIYKNADATKADQWFGENDHYFKNDQDAYFEIEKHLSDEERQGDNWADLTESLRIKNNQYYEARRAFLGNTMEARQKAIDQAVAGKPSQADKLVSQRDFLNEQIREAQSALEHMVLSVANNPDDVQQGKLDKDAIDKAQASLREAMAKRDEGIKKILEQSTEDFEELGEAFDEMLLGSEAKSPRKQISKAVKKAKENAKEALSDLDERVEKNVISENDWVAQREKWEDRLAKIENGDYQKTLERDVREKREKELHALEKKVAGTSGTYEARKQNIEEVYREAQKIHDRNIAEQKDESISPEERIKSAAEAERAISLAMQYEDQVNSKSREGIAKRISSLSEIASAKEKTPEEQIAEKIQKLRDSIRQEIDELNEAKNTGVYNKDPEEYTRRMQMLETAYNEAETSYGEKLRSQESFNREQQNISLQMDRRQLESQLTGTDFNREQEIAQERDRMLLARNRMAQRIRQQYGEDEANAFLQANKKDVIENNVRQRYKDQDAITQAQRAYNEAVAQNRRDQTIEQQLYSTEDFYRQQKNRYVMSGPVRALQPYMERKIQLQRQTYDILPKRIEEAQLRQNQAWERLKANKEFKKSTEGMSENEAKEFAKNFIPDTQKAKQALADYAESGKDIQNLNEQLSNNKQELENLGKFGTQAGAVFDNIGASVQRVLSQFGRQLFRKALQETKQFVKQFNASMIEIQAITLKTDDQMAKVRTDTIQKAIDLHTSVSNVSATEAALYRQGLSDEDVETRTEDIIKFASVAGIKVEAATKILTTALQNELVSSSQEAMDALVALGDGAATTAEDIGKAMQKCAAAAKVAGVSYQDLTAMLATMTSMTQLSGTQVGTAMNTIMTRMRQVTTNKLVKDQNGEVTTLSDVETALKLAGIDLYKEGDHNKGFRSVSDVLKDVAGKWQNMSDVTKANLTTAIAGTRMGNMFQTLMEGISEDDTFEKYLGLAGDSEGITDDKYEVMINGITAAIDTLRSSWDQLVESLESSGIITGGIEFLTGIIQGVTNLNKVLGGSVTAILAVATAIGAAVALIKVAAMPGGAVLAPLAAMGIAAAGLGIAGSIGKMFDQPSEEDQNKQIKQKYNDYVSSAKADQQSYQSLIDQTKELGDEYDRLGSNMDAAGRTKLEDNLKTLLTIFPNLKDSIGDVSDYLEHWSEVVTGAKQSLQDLGEISLEQANKWAQTLASKNFDEAVDQAVENAYGQYGKTTHVTESDLRDLKNATVTFGFGKLSNPELIKEEAEEVYTGYFSSLLPTRRVLNTEQRDNLINQLYEEMSSAEQEVSDATTKNGITKISIDNVQSTIKDLLATKESLESQSAVQEALNSADQKSLESANSQIDSYRSILEQGLVNAEARIAEINDRKPTGIEVATEGLRQLFTEYPDLQNDFTDMFKKEDIHFFGETDGDYFSAIRNYLTGKRREILPRLFRSEEFQSWLSDYGLNINDYIEEDENGRTHLTDKLVSDFMRVNMTKQNWTISDKSSLLEDPYYTNLVESSGLFESWQEELNTAIRARDSFVMQLNNVPNVAEGKTGNLETAIKSRESLIGDIEDRIAAIDGEIAQYEQMLADLGEQDVEEAQKIEEAKAKSIRLKQSYSSTLAHIVQFAHTYDNIYDLGAEKTTSLESLDAVKSVLSESETERSSFVNNDYAAVYRKSVNDKQRSIIGDILTYMFDQGLLNAKGPLTNDNGEILYSTSEEFRKGFEGGFEHLRGDQFDYIAEQLHSAINDYDNSSLGLYYSALSSTLEGVLKQQVENYQNEYVPYLQFNSNQSELLGKAFHNRLIEMVGEAQDEEGNYLYREGGTKEGRLIWSKDWINANTLNDYYSRIAEEAGSEPEKFTQENTKANDYNYQFRFGEGTDIEKDYIGFQTKEEVDAYLKEYAKKNKISLEEARERVTVGENMQKAYGDNGILTIGSVVKNAYSSLTPKKRGYDKEYQSLLRDLKAFGTSGLINEDIGEYQQLIESGEDAQLLKIWQDINTNGGQYTDEDLIQYLENKVYGSQRTAVQNKLSASSYALAKSRSNLERLRSEEQSEELYSNIASALGWDVNQVYADADKAASRYAETVAQEQRDLEQEVIDDIYKTYNIEKDENGVFKPIKQETLKEIRQRYGDNFDISMSRTGGLSVSYKGSSVDTRAGLRNRAPVYTNEELRDTAQRLASSGLSWSEILDSEAYKDLSNEHLNAVANYSPELARYLQMSSEQQQSTEGQALKRTYEEQFKVEGLSDLERAGELLEGTSELVAQLQKGGSFEIKAKLNLQSQLSENAQQEALLNNGSFAEQMQAISDITGLKDYEIQNLGFQESKTLAQNYINARNDQQARTLEAIYGSLGEDEDAQWLFDLASRFGYENYVDETGLVKFRSTGSPNVGRSNAFLGKALSYSDYELAKARADIISGKLTYETDNELYQAAAASGGRYFQNYNAMKAANQVNPGTYSPLETYKAYRLMRKEEKKAQREAEDEDKLSAYALTELDEDIVNRVSNMYKTLKYGDAADKLSLYGEWGTSVDELRKAQYAVNRGANTETYRGYIASVLGISEEQVKEKMASSEGAKEIQEALHQKTEDLLKSVLDGLNLALGTEFDSSDLSSLAAQLEESKEKIGDGAYNFLKTILDSYDSISGLFTGSDKNADFAAALDSAVEKFSEGRVTERGYEWLYEHSNEVSAAYDRTVAPEELAARKDALKQEAKSAGIYWGSFMNDNPLVAAALNNLGNGVTNEDFNEILEAGYSGVKGREYYTALGRSTLGNQYVTEEGMLKTPQTMAEANELRDRINELKSDTTGKGELFAEYAAGMENMSDVVSAIASGDIDKISKAVKGFNDQVSDKRTAEISKYGNTADKSLKKMASYYGKINDLTYKNQKLNDAQKKLDQGVQYKNLGSKEQAVLQEYTGLTNEQLEAVGADAIKSFVKGAQDSIGEQWAQEVAQPMIDSLNDYFNSIKDSDEAIQIQRAVEMSVQGDGTVDVSQLADAVAAFDENLANALRAYDGVGGTLTAELLSGDNMIGYLLHYAGSSAGTKGGKGGGGGGGGGGKSPLDELLEKQKHEVAAQQHEIKMTQIQETHYERLNEYDKYIDTLDEEIQKQAELRDIYQRHVKELTEMQSGFEEYSDDWWKCKEAIDAANEAIAEFENTAAEINAKKITAIETKQENQDKPGTHKASMYEKRAQYYMDRGQFENYEVLANKQIDQMRADIALNNQQISEWEGMLGLYEENSKEWIEVRDKIWATKEENADLENQALEKMLDLQQQRIAQIQTDYQNEIAAENHEINMLGTWGGIYQNAEQYGLYRDSLRQQNDYNKQNLAATQGTIATLEKELATLEKGSTAWYAAREALYSYEEMVAQLTATIQENDIAIEESVVSELQDKYDQYSKDMEHELNMITAYQDRYDKANDFENYQNMLGEEYDKRSEYLEGMREHLAAMEAELNGDNLTAGGPQWRALKENIESVRESIVTTETELEELNRKMQQSELEHILERFENQNGLLDHQIKLIQYDETRYQNNGELTNYGTMLEYENGVQQEKADLIRQQIDLLEEQLAKAEPGSEVYKKITNEIYKMEEALAATTNAIEKNNEAIRKNQENILKTRKALIDIIDAEKKQRIKEERERLSATVSVENQILNIIKERYRKEWQLVKEDINKKKQALQEEKALINERLNARLNADKEADRYEELSELQRQLTLISADPTRTKDAIELQKKIDDLLKENANAIAQQEAQSAGERIDDEMKAYDEYMSYNEAKLNEMLKDNNSTPLYDELNAVLGDENEPWEDRFENYMDWIKQNDENYKYGTEAMRLQIEQNNQDSWKKMVGFIDTYWDKIKDIIDGGVESVLEFMKTDSSYAYQYASEEGQGLMEMQWEEAYRKYAATFVDDAVFNDVHDIAEKVSELQDYTYKVEITPETLYDLGVYLSELQYDYARDKSVSNEAKNYTVDDMYEGTGKKTYEVNGQTYTVQSTAEPTSSGSGSGGKGTKKYIYEIFDEKGNKTNYTIEATSEKEATDKLITKLDELGSRYVGNVKESKTGDVVKTVQGSTVAAAGNVAEKITNAISNFFDELNKPIVLGATKKFASGGLVDYTGPAWVDGTKTRPESFLDAVDTENIRALTDSLMYVRTMPMLSPGNGFFGNSQTIGDINIVINQAELKSDADYDEVARKVGQAFTRQLSKEGFQLANYSW